MAARFWVVSKADLPYVQQATMRVPNGDVDEYGNEVWYYPDMPKKIDRKGPFKNYDVARAEAGANETVVSEGY